MSKTALIVGTGSGISAAFARALAADGYTVALTARKVDKLAALAGQIGALTIAADATQADSVAQLFAEVDSRLGRLDAVLYNASYRVRKPFLDLKPQEVARSLEVTGAGKHDDPSPEGEACGPERGGGRRARRSRCTRSGATPSGASRAGVPCGPQPLPAPSPP